MIPSPPNASAARFGRLALGFSLVGLAFPMAMAASHLLTGMRLDSWLWIGVFALTGLFELPALVMGIIGWKSRASKAAVMVTALLPLLLVAGGVILYPARNLGEESKLVAAAAGLGKATLASNETTPSFGPVIERVVTNEIDLDTGSLKPDELKGGGHYPDALYENPVFVFSASTERIQLTGNDYDGLSPEQLQAAMDKRINSSDLTFNKETAKLPITLGFRTSSGRMGILQITGFTDNPHGLKIRYKLVQVGPLAMETELRLIEMPDDTPLDVAKLDFTAIERKPGVRILSAPGIVTLSGQEGVFEMTSGHSSDALAPSPVGITARLRPVLDGDTVHYAVKLSVSTRQNPNDNERTIVHQHMHYGDARIDQPVIVNMGKTDKGHPYLARLVFRRGNATPAAGAAPATTAASGSGPEVVRVPEPGGFLFGGFLLLILALVAGLIILVVIVVIVVSLARRTAANQPAAGLTASGAGVPGLRSLGEVGPPANPQSNGPDAKAVRFGRLALGLCLVGLVFPVAMTAVHPLTGMRLDWWIWIGVFVLAGLFELPALVMGIIGWKSRAGKAAVMVAVALPLLAVPGGVILTYSSERAKAVAAQSRAISDHKVKQDSVMLDPQWKELRESWLRGQPRLAYEMANYDAVLRFDLEQDVVVLRDGLQVVREVRLPFGYKWSFHRVTPQGTEDLGKLAELKIRHRKDQRNVCQEAYILRGKLGADAGISLDILTGGSGWQWGDGLVKLPVGGYDFRPYNGPNKDVVDQSLLVTAPANMATLPKFGPVVEHVFNDLDEGRGNEALHLQTGTLSSVPADAQKDRKVLDAWLKTNRMDLLADFARNRWSLLSIGLTLADFPAARWDEATPADLTPALASGTTLERLERSGQVFYLLPEQPQWPVTFAFKTRESDQGLLQITGVTDNPRGVEIRYKLVIPQPGPQRIEQE